MSNPKLENFTKLEELDPFLDQAQENVAYIEKLQQKIRDKHKAQMAKELFELIERVTISETAYRQAFLLDDVLYIAATFGETSNDNAYEAITWDKLFEASNGTSWDSPPTGTAYQYEHVVKVCGNETMVFVFAYVTCTKSHPSGAKEYIQLRQYIRS